MKKKIILLISLCIGLLAVGCGNNPSKLDESVKSKKEEVKTIVDATGIEVVLDKKVERISILHSAYLEYFMALEHPPTASAGSSTGNAMKALQEWESLKGYDQAIDIMDLGSSRDLNLEAILKSNPDVIVTFKDHGKLDAIYDQLIKIAPLIRLDFSKTWQEQTMECAEIIGKEDLAKEIIAETEKVIDKTHEELKTYDETLAIFRTDGKSFIVRGDKDYYESFGINKPKGFPDTYESLSLETLAEMNPDYIVFQDYYDVSKAFVKSLSDSPVWNNLDAVKNEKIFYFDDSLNTLGPISRRITAEKLLDIYQGK